MRVFLALLTLALAVQWGDAMMHEAMIPKPTPVFPYVPRPPAFKAQDSNGHENNQDYTYPTLRYTCVEPQFPVPKGKEGEVQRVRPTAPVRALLAVQCQETIVRLMGQDSAATDDEKAFTPESLCAPLKPSNVLADLFADKTHYLLCSALAKDLKKLWKVMGIHIKGLHSLWGEIDHAEARQLTASQICDRVGCQLPNAIVPGCEQYKTPDPPVEVPARDKKCQSTFKAHFTSLSADCKRCLQWAPHMRQPQPCSKIADPAAEAQCKQLLGVFDQRHSERRPSAQLHEVATSDEIPKEWSGAARDGALCRSCCVSRVAPLRCYPTADGFYAIDLNK